MVKLLLICLAGLLGGLVMDAFASEPAPRSLAIPDFTQSAMRGAAFGDGEQFCGPVAVSNSIMGFGWDQSDQYDLIARLAGDGYMRTSLVDGTGTSALIRGVDRLVREWQGDYASLQFRGWRQHPAEFSAGRVPPDLTWIADRLDTNTAVWLNVGFYTVDDRRLPTLRRLSGHWVTVVGVRGTQLMIHDPSPRAGNSPAVEIVETQQVRSGRLVGNKRGLPVAAVGYLRLGQGMHIKSGADWAIVDGAVRLRLNP